MNSISYKVYNDFKGWKLIGVEKKPMNVITLISDTMKTEKATYLVVEHDHGFNCDNPLKPIYDEEDLLELQGRLLNVPRGIENVHTKQKQLSRGR